MKQLFTALLLFIGISVFSQITITVSLSDTIVCSGDSVAFVTEVTGARPYMYTWYRNGEQIMDAMDSVYAVPVVDYADTGVYICVVTNHVDLDTSNSVRLQMYPKMKIDTLYRYNDLGCPGSCKGQFKALVSGGTPPYDFNWGAGFSQDTIVFGLCQGSYTLRIKDDHKCVVDSGYYVDVLRLPKIEISVLPGDTVYLTKPMITASFPDSSATQLTNWEWEFGDSSTFVPNNNPAYYIFPDTTSPGQHTIKLNYTDLNGCDTTITHDITVKIAKLTIPNIFTPDDNGINDTFVIELEDSDLAFSDVFISTDLVILDRWGRHIYSKTNYVSGEWDGKDLSDGAYFYILTCEGFYGTEVYKGSVTILRDK